MSALPETVRRVVRAAWWWVARMLRPGPHHPVHPPHFG